MTFGWGWGLQLVVGETLDDWWLGEVGGMKTFSSIFWEQLIMVIFCRWCFYENWPELISV